MSEALSSKRYSCRHNLQKLAELGLAEPIEKVIGMKLEDYKVCEYVDVFDTSNPMRLFMHLLNNGQWTIAEVLPGLDTEKFNRYLAENRGLESARDVFVELVTNICDGEDDLDKYMDMLKGDVFDVTEIKKFLHDQGYRLVTSDEVDGSRTDHFFNLFDENEDNCTPFKEFEDYGSE